MKYLNTLLNDVKTVVFLDLEGTQLSQEIIAIGAIKCTLDSKNQIKNEYKPFKIYIKSHDKVGKYIEKLTGISDAFLQKNGVSFAEAIKEFERYVGQINNIKYFTYGNFDMRLLHQTCNINKIDNNHFIYSIYNNHIDYSSYLSRYVKSKKGEMLSLLDALKLFKQTPTGNQHDPVYDAINLMNLYRIVLKEKGILRNEYMHVLISNPHLPRPIHKVINEIYNNKDIKKEDFIKFIDEEL